MQHRQTSDHTLEPFIGYTLWLQEDFAHEGVSYLLQYLLSYLLNYLLSYLVGYLLSYLFGYLLSYLIGIQVVKTFQKGDTGVCVVLIWKGIEVPQENPLVKAGNQKPPHTTTPGIKFCLGW